MPKKKRAALLTKDEILGKNDLIVEDVNVPEWGGSVRVRSLTGVERDEYESSLIIGSGKDREVSLANARARMVYLSVVDEDGIRLFNNPADVKQLGGKNAAALDRVFAVCQRLSGMRKEDVDELLGNSGPVPNGASTSD